MQWCTWSCEPEWEMGMILCYRRRCWWERWWKWQAFRWQRPSSPWELTSTTLCTITLTRQGSRSGARKRMWLVSAARTEQCCAVIVVASVWVWSKIKEDWLDLLLFFKWYPVPFCAACSQSQSGAAEQCTLLSSLGQEIRLDVSVPLMREASHCCWICVFLVCVADAYVDYLLILKCFFVLWWVNTVILWSSVFAKVWLNCVYTVHLMGYQVYTCQKWNHLHFALVRHVISAGV